MFLPKNLPFVYIYLENLFYNRRDPVPSINVKVWENHLKRIYPRPVSINQCFMLTDLHFTDAKHCFTIEFSRKFVRKA